MLDLRKRLQNGKSKNKKERNSCCIVLTREDRLDFFRESTPIAFDPLKDGTCQFSALFFFLRTIGTERSPETLKDLRKHPNDLEGFPLELFAGQGWDGYSA